VTNEERTMSDLAQIASLPDVKSAVLGDLAGGFHDAVRESDGETVAAVMGFVSSAMAQAGEELGLGALRRVAVASEARACIVVVRGDQVITACVEPGKSLPAVEKVLDISVHGKV
jgi:predicted regulator of Ras-like GTPase activity (Roadblock/LC7/MglB family)